MVSRGPRPEHRRGTTGKAYARWRESVIEGKTRCQRCGRAFVRDARCAHPRHAHMPGCPTHPSYPTAQHTRALVHGSVPLPKDGEAWCMHCNASHGATLGNALRGHVRRTATKDRNW